MFEVRSFLSGKRDFSRIKSISAGVFLRAAFASRTARPDMRTGGPAFRRPKRGAQPQAPWTGGNAESHAGAAERGPAIR